MLFLSSMAFPWGFYAHKMIARNAVFILPQEMLGFYKKHLGRITEGSVQPDIRRFISDEEAPRHYIDLELYGEFKDSVLFFDWRRAITEFGRDTLNSRGILPWAIINTYYELTDAFRSKSPERIIRYSADLTHYISDAHVPLHTTYNYDGQFTDQDGIHRLWESLVPEASAESYSFWLGKSEYLPDIYSSVRNIIRTSHSMVDSVLYLEKALSDSLSADRKYSFQKRGSREVKLHSGEFVKLYEKSLNGMVERRMRSAIKMTGNFWYTSWIEAGQPDLSTIKSKIEQGLEHRVPQNPDSAKTGNRTRIHSN